ncbi:MAG: peptidase M23 [Betaproteobacteria bacterium]|nr:peptidase M23 [Betaproteobacteria bacterium]
MAALRQKLSALRGELEQRESSRREARDALRVSETAISEAGRALAKLEADARVTRSAMAQLAAQRQSRELALAGQQTALGRLLAARAVAEMSGGAPVALRIALSGEDPAQTARTLHYLTYLSKAAAELIDSHREGLAELDRLRESTAAKALELSAIETGQRADRDRLLGERRERQRVLERVAVEIREARKELRFAEADEKRLTRVIEEIGRVLTTRPGAGYGRVDRVPDANTAGGPFSALRGRLRLPVKGEIARRPGPTKGVFIRATEGEPVRAVAAGRVVYAEWMRGFGNLLIVDHGEDYFSVYGNNDALLKQAGDVVAPGDTLATVGASGGNEETGLYFELRHLGRAFDPLSWARK